MAPFLPSKQDVTARRTAHLLTREIVLLHGAPSSIVADPDSKIHEQYVEGDVSITKYETALVCSLSAADMGRQREPLNQ